LKFRTKGQGNSRKVYPVSPRRVRTGTMQTGTAHLSVPKRITQKTNGNFAVSLLDSNGTRRFQHTGFSTEKPNGTIKFFNSEKEAQAYIDSMTLMTQKAYEPKIVDLSHGAIPKKEQELRDIQLKRYSERSPEEVAKSKQQISEIERNIEKDMQKSYYVSVPSTKSDSKAFSNMEEALDYREKMVEKHSDDNSYYITVSDSSGNLLERGAMMKEAKNLRDRGDILNARILESMQKSGTKAVRNSSGDFAVERNGYRLKLKSNTAFRRTITFWSKEQAENYINGEMVKGLENGTAEWRKIE